MSLTSAINTAKSALAATQAQTALVARNIANANTEGATRKYANVVTGSGGRVEIRSIAQSQNSVLYRNMLDSSAALQQSTAIRDGLSRINEMIGDIEKDNTPAALMGKLTDKLKAYAASPQSADFARAAVDAARNVATALSEGTRTVDVIRRDADNALVDAADDMNKILARIETLNREVVSGTAANRDVTDLVDERDREVGKLAGYVGLTAQVRGNNDLVLYTDSGVTLFDRTARSVSFGATNPLVDGQAGNGFRIDGTLVTGRDAVMPIKSGKIAGLVQLRDVVTVKYQTQLDEMARGLVAATSEFKAGGSPANTIGLFDATGTPVLTADAALTGPAVPGLARRLVVNAAIVADPTKLRDGLNGAYNSATPAAGYTVRINEIVRNLGVTRTFAADAATLTSGTLADFAAGSTSWLQESRAGATSDTEYKQTLLDRTKETLSNGTGVNLNDEYLSMTSLERSFQASSKILNTVDEMMKTLLNAI